MQDFRQLPRYDFRRSYEWNYARAPDPVEVEIPSVPGRWTFCGLPVDSPLGIPAGPLLNGRWCLYYASLGFDVLTYKTVRSQERECYPEPNLLPVRCGQLAGEASGLPASDTMQGSWAVSFGMPSRSPAVWRQDVEHTRRQLPAGKLLVVSVVGTIQPGWTIEQLAEDYARCAKWAVESGADAIETNFSCPNVSTCDGQLYQQPRDAALVAQRVREVLGSTPLLIKIGHVASVQAAELLIHAVQPWANALVMTNSIAATVQAGGQLLFDGRPRGICGDAIRTRSVAQLAAFAQQLRRLDCDLSLVGVGGVGNARHVGEMLAAGAQAVHLATAAMLMPEVALQIRQEFSGIAKQREMAR